MTNGATVHGGLRTIFSFFPFSFYITPPHPSQPKLKSYRARVPYTRIDGYYVCLPHVYLATIMCWGGPKYNIYLDLYAIYSGTIYVDRGVYKIRYYNIIYYIITYVQEIMMLYCDKAVEKFKYCFFTIILKNKTCIKQHSQSLRKKNKIKHL